MRDILRELYCARSQLRRKRVGRKSIPPALRTGKAASRR